MNKSGYYQVMISRSIGKTTAAVLYSWLAVALAVSVSGVLEKASFFIVGPLVFAQLGLLILALYLLPNFRRFIANINMRWLTMFHVWRVIPGVMFLVLALTNLLPFIAITAGIGDIAVAIAAPIVADRSPDRKQYWFHILGFLDLLHVIATGLTVYLKGDARVELLTHFPVSLLPLFLVPLTLGVHVFAIYNYRNHSN